MLSHYLCQAPALSVSGPALSVSSPVSVSGPAALRHSLCQGGPAVSVFSQRSRGLALSVSEPGLCVGVLCRGPAVCVGPVGALCVGLRWSPCRDPALFLCQRRARLCLALCQGLQWSGPSALCVGALHSLCRAPALSVSRPALSVGVCVLRTALSGPGTLCRGPALSVSGRRSLRLSAPALCRCPVLSTCPCSLCRAPVRSRRSLCLGLALCVGAWRFLCRGSSCQGSALCVGPRRSLFSSSPDLSGWAGFEAQLQSACAPIRVPPIQPPGPQLRSACHPSSPARSLFSGENPKPYCLGDKQCTDIKTSHPSCSVEEN